MTALRIAWIGAGKMGLPVCKRLKAAGHDVVVLARRPDQAAKLAELGLAVATAVPSLIASADVIFTCVPDDHALGEVVLNEKFTSILPGSATLIDMSTVSPRISKKIAAQLPASVAYLRSPVSGSTAMAEAGTLTALVSGPKSGFDTMAGLFGVFTKKAFYLGTAEEARYLKLAINSIVAATSALMGEALAFGLNGGLSHETMLEVINQSAVASPLIGYKTDMIIRADYRPAATLNMLKKDLELLLSAAQEQKTPLPVNSMIRQIYQSAADKGLGERDFFVLVQEAEKAADITAAR
jgi:3-hydroxyisobutyrate dehydrogenase-like beta-hydroxyacid dehydrogenase